MNTTTATNARSNLFNLLKEVQIKHLPIRISSKEGTSILLAEEDYESLVETAELLSLPNFKKSITIANKQIKNGEIFTVEDVFSN